MNYRHGLDRLYFLLTLAWFLTWYLAFLIETLDEKVNLYTDNLVAVVLYHILVLAAPFVAYVILVMVFKTFLWVINGFREIDTTASQTKVKIFAGNESFFGLVKKHGILILGSTLVLVSIGLFVSFTFTSYSERPEPQNVTIPKIFLPRDEQ